VEFMIDFNLMQNVTNFGPLRIRGNSPKLPNFAYTETFCLPECEAIQCVRELFLSRTNLLPSASFIG
jgi:hypothetical protein